MRYFVFSGKWANRRQYACRLFRDRSWQNICIYLELKKGTHWKTKPIWYDGILCYRRFCLQLILWIILMELAVLFNIALFCFQISLHHALCSIHPVTFHGSHELHRIRGFEWQKNLVLCRKWSFLTEISVLFEICLAAIIAPHSFMAFKKAYVFFSYCRQGR